jgi:putative acetyltransferase
VNEPVDAKRAFYMGLAALPGSAGPDLMPTGETEPERLPPGIAGKRVKPWRFKRALLARTLRAVLPWDDAFLPEIADLWVASWAKTMPTIDFEARRPWLLDHLAKALDAGQAIRVAVVETGDVVGFVLIDPATGWLDQIAVAPAQWGAGIAEALLRAAREISPERIGLDVNADNPRAVAFYGRQGFAEVGRGENPRSGLPTLKLEWRRDRAG